MDLSKEQLDFIVYHMKKCIKECTNDIEKYGFQDEATAGSDDAIKMAQSIISEIYIVEVE